MTERRTSTRHHLTPVEHGTRAIQGGSVIARSRARRSILRWRRTVAKGIATVAMTFSRQFDIAVDFKFEINAADRNDSLSWQCAAGQFSLRIGVANRLLDLSLGSDAELLEELAYAGVEGVVVHNRSS